MSIAQAMLQEFEMESATTRKFLERVPAGKYDWKPHEKSMTLGRLAGHVAEMGMWGQMTAEMDEIDIAPVGQEPYKACVATSPEQLLADFDKYTAAFKQALPKVTDEKMMKPWSLKAGGNTLFTIPRVACLRNFVLNHNVHHRAQLGVYFRLLDIPVPQTYGPSADETGM